jgi:hypothetical protein
MKEKIIKTIVVLVLSVLCMQIDAQTIIREKVKIKPNSISAKLMKTKVDYPPLEIYVGGERPFTYSVSGPGGSASGANPGYGAPYSYSTIASVNGEYQATIVGGCECTSGVDFSVIWNNGFTYQIASYGLTLLPN